MKISTKLGVVQIATAKHRAAMTVNCQSNKAAYAELSIFGRPKEIPVNVNVELADSNEFSFYMAGTKPEPVGSEGLAFEVPVKWEERIGRGGNAYYIPKTREKGRDNVDVILLAADGSFVDVRVGVITRSGNFYITAQVAYEGALAKADTGELVYVPTNPTFARTDYEAAWPYMAKDLMETAIIEPRPTSEVEVAKWSPKAPEGYHPNGRLIGAVKFFEMITGWGEVEGSDGRTYGIHFNQILDVPKGRIPVLDPMSFISFKPGEENGKLVAKVIKSIA